VTPLSPLWDSRPSFKSVESDRYGCIHIVIQTMDYHFHPVDSASSFIMNTCVDFAKSSLIISGGYKYSFHIMRVSVLFLHVRYAPVPSTSITNVSCVARRFISVTGVEMCTPV
jgi:hypothetical protein